MGDPERCNSYIEYQSLPRTIVEALFSVFTLALRVCHPIFYSVYNCVNGGPYTGWKALSSLLCILQAIVQWMSAMTLLELYIPYRSDDNGGAMIVGASAAATGEEGEAVSVSPSTDAVYVNTPSTSSWTMQIAVGITAAVVLSISFAYMGLDQHPVFDPDEWQSGSYGFPVYLIGLSIWMTLLFIPNTAFLFLPAVNQIHAVKASGDHGSLSLVSLGLQGALFVVLAGLQAARDWNAIAWVPRNQLWPTLRFVEPFFAWYGTVQTHVAYVVTGASCFVVLAVCLLEERRRRAEEGRVQILTTRIED
ncbi:hypothetical protein SPBR_02979 [Sporothrix brasiliensis 5110]|uniref:Uncharacterized protein n=1 Tax=Sporothrix brasiliensis 5110 TaxID=1398154 RepID=A0A0C2ITL0_9PEZI|nr:uncharacterized protein SPBR_02979 [Sporothrix brasiliensis 5110]KIH92416.1 hypothetical protein SPBR_02979 [Sporothrix brasiliensis 5110]